MLIPLLLAIATPVAAPAFDPLRFFAGCTRGEGRLKIVLRAPRPVHVDGRGRIAADGTLVLDQQVRMGDEPAKSRQWRLRRIAPDRYAGTLSDARGAVTGETTGDRLHLAFVGRDGSHIEQWLTLAADGRSAANVLTAKRLGVRVARLEERISRIERCPMSAETEPR